MQPDYSPYLINPKVQFPLDLDRCKIIQNSENVGFAKANNQALKICAGGYALLLNSDTGILGNALDVMVEFMNTH